MYKKGISDQNANLKNQVRKKKNEKLIRAEISY